MHHSVWILECTITFYIPNTYSRRQSTNYLNIISPKTSSFDTGIETRIPIIPCRGLRHSLKDFRPYCLRIGNKTWRKDVENCDEPESQWLPSFIVTLPSPIIQNIRCFLVSCYVGAIHIYSRIKISIFWLNLVKWIHVHIWISFWNPVKTIIK